MKNLIKSVATKIVTAAMVLFVGLLAIAMIFDLNSASEPVESQGIEKISWREFDLDDFHNSLARSKAIFVIGRPSYHVETGFWDVLLQRQDISESLHQADVVCYRLDYNGWHDDKVDDLFSISQPTKDPIALFFDKNGHRHNLTIGAPQELLGLLAKASQR